MTAVFDAIVVGAGVSGLVAARQLEATGIRVAVIDPNEAPGGHARTTRQPDGFAWEWGPHTVTPSATTVLRLAEELGMGGDLVRPGGPGTRYIFRGGVLHALPSGPAGLLRSRALSRRGWLRLLAEPLVPARPVDGESVHDFFARRLGTEAADVLVNSFVSGIHAGDPHALGMADAFPTVTAWERDHGGVLRGALAAMRRRRRTSTPGSARRGILAFRGGMGSFTASLAASLGGDLLLGHEVTRISPSAHGYAVRAGRRVWHAPRVVVATPPGAAARLLSDLAPRASAVIDQVSMSPLAVVHLMGRGGSVPEGFGALVPRSEGLRTLGALFVPNHVPSRTPDGGWMVTCMLGGATDPTILDLSDSELIDQARAEVLLMTGFHAQGSAVVVRHARAIPQLRPGHLDRMAEALRAVSAVPGLALAGNYTLGVSLENAACSGVAAAVAVQTSLRAAA